MKDRLTLDQPAEYRIEIQGVLGQHWTEYLGGLEIDVSQKREASVTILSGSVIDQAALLGVLNSLYSLGYPLLAVEYQFVPKE